MGLPWARLDSNIASHDKILALLSDPSPKKWQALASYMCSFAWSTGQGTDGLIPRFALPAIHGTTATARLLEKYHMWVEAPTGWAIVNFHQRQSLSAAADSAREAKRLGAAKGNCIRHHGPDCGCWKEAS